MGKKRKTIDIKSPEEVYAKLFACINCVYEFNCEDILPFPLNLCDCCERYIKVEKDFD